MIIEGKHSEAGQGIFVSDIQEGNSAEQVDEIKTKTKKLNQKILKKTLKIITGWISNW